VKKILLASVVLAALCVPALAQNQGGNSQGGNNNNQGGNGGAHGVPGPLVGAGLPFFAVGYGVYWIVRRRRKSTTPSA
jgi:hypothetical protein